MVTAAASSLETTVAVTHERNVAMPRQHEPAHLESTVDMLRAAFPEGIGCAQRIPVMRALYDYMSDRNLVDVMCFVLDEANAVTLNDVYRCAQMDPLDDAVKGVIKLLNEHGFADWKNEP
jgi:hypothetical protein